MVSQEEKFLDYLDQAVEYEKNKLLAMKMVGMPFDLEKVVNAVNKYEEKTLKTKNQCTSKMIANKVLKNTMLRRFFEVVVREGIEDIDFTTLSHNPRYLELKNKILKHNADLIGLDNKTFLKQIANAIAHGNYVDLLKIDKLEDRWKLHSEDESLDFGNGSGEFSLAYLCNENNISKYDTKTASNLKKINSISPLISATPLQFYMMLLEGSPLDAAEVLKIRYDEVDSKKGITKNRELELSFKDIDEIAMFVVSNFTDRKFTTLFAKDESAPNPLSDSNSPSDDAKKILEYNKVVIADAQGKDCGEIELDSHQTQFFIDEYVHTREMFPKENYEELFGNTVFADMLCTNMNTPLLDLSQLHTNSKLEKLSHHLYLLSTDMKSYLGYILQVFKGPKTFSLVDIISNEMKKNHSIKQVYNTYTESLLTEVLLLLQIVEDKGLYDGLSSNKTIGDAVGSMDTSALTHFRASTKYGNDQLSLLKHLRNSLTHMNYLISPNGELYIYDYKSRKNKTPDYKFSVNISTLENIKDELFSLVSDHYHNMLSDDVSRESSK